MTISTLSYIHDLLVKENHVEDSMQRTARRVWLDAAENDHPETEKLHERYNEAKARYDRAYDALQDFLTHKFH